MTEGRVGAAVSPADPETRTRRDRSGDRHRGFRWRAQHGRPGPGERRLLRRGQPAPGAHARHGGTGVQGRRHRPAHRDGARRAQPGLLNRPRRRGARVAGARVLAPRALRRRRRRGADPPVRERPAAAPATGRRAAVRRHPGRTGAAGRGPGDRRRRDRHQPSQRQPAAQPGRGALRGRGRPPAPGDRPVVRIQVWGAARTRTSSSTRVSCPTRTGCRNCASTAAGTSAVSQYVLGQRGAKTFVETFVRLVNATAPGFRAGRQAVPDRRGGVYRRPAPQRRHRRGTRPPAARTPPRRPAPSTGTWGGSRGRESIVRVVAFGGGHGLGACLRALRLLRADLALDITAVVTVGDDGGSSGRLRAERGGLPPGDLRQALAALVDPDDAVARRNVELLQFRFDGSDPLAGHAVGNLLLCRPDGADRRSGDGAGPCPGHGRRRRPGAADGPDAAEHRGRVRGDDPPGPER